MTTEKDIIVDEDGDWEEDVNVTRCVIEGPYYCTECEEEYDELEDDED